MKVYTNLPLFLIALIKYHYNTFHVYGGMSVLYKEGGCVSSDNRLAILLFGLEITLFRMFFYFS